jgi:hypothetical protein
MIGYGFVNFVLNLLLTCSLQNLEDNCYLSYCYFLAAL